jgi:4,5-DOPA dioxygenase extradiol
MSPAEDAGHESTSTTPAERPIPHRMPAAFIGHGSPMNTLEDNRFTRAWVEFAATLPRPNAILAISAHWWTKGSAVTVMDAPRTIHDFSGFPPELFAVSYPAPGSLALASSVIGLLSPYTAVIADTAWGLDHGTWSVLARMFPAADIPVVQLSVDAGATTAQRVALGAALAPLRDEGVFILASGNVVHNLAMMSWHEPDTAFDWNTAFDDRAREIMTTDPIDIVTLHEHPAFSLAAPTPEHLQPLDYIAGLAVAAETTAEVLVDGPMMGSLSMTSYIVGS